MTPHIGEMIESFNKLSDKIETNKARMSSIESTCHYIIRNIQQTNQVSFPQFSFAFHAHFVTFHNFLIQCFVFSTKKRSKN